MRLDQILDHLFAQAGTELVLESNSTGVFRKEGVADAPVFRQVLRTGQILLLFADVVPKEHSPALLAGQPIDFEHRVRQGAVKVHMEMRGSEIHVDVRPVPGARNPLSPIETPVPVAATAGLVKLLTDLPGRRASHLHLVSGQPAFLRVEGALVACPEAGVFQSAQIREALLSVAPKGLRPLVLEHPRFDFSYVNGSAIFHVRAQTTRSGLAVVVRALPKAVPSAGALGVPAPLVAGMTGRGLWVVAGGAGQGTSTTLAAVAQAVLNGRPTAVCCVESPIEYVLSPGLGVVQQLEVGTHVESFPEALLEVRTTDADLLVIGELDEPETLERAVALADRGRLVVGALHALHSLDAAAKLFASLSSNRAMQLRLAAVLRGVFAQQLVPNLTGGRSLAWEVLESSDPVRALLRDGAFPRLGEHRSHRLEDSLLELVLKGEVDADEALAVASERDWLELRLKQVGRTRAA